MKTVKYSFFILCAILFSASVNCDYTEPVTLDTDKKIISRDVKCLGKCVSPTFCLLCYLFYNTFSQYAKQPLMKWNWLLKKLIQEKKLKLVDFE